MNNATVRKNLQKVNLRLFYLADVKMNHVRGSGGGAQIRASHSQSDPVSLGKTTFSCH